MGIKAKLFTFVVGILIFGVSGTAYWNASQVEESVLTILKENQKGGAALAARDIQKTLDKLLYTLEETTYSSYARELLKNKGNAALTEEAHKRLRRIEQSVPEAAIVAFVYPDGIVAASSAREACGKLNLADRGYFKESMQGKSVFSDPIKSRTTGKPSVMLSAPIKDGEKIIGVSYITVDLDKVFASVAMMKSGENGYAFVTDRNGIMLYHPDPKRIFAETRSEQWAAPLWQGGNEGYFETPFGSSTWLVNYTTMPQTGWKVLLNAEDKDFLSSVHILRNRSLMAFGVLFVVIALVVWFFADALGKELARGVAFAKRVEDGDFNARWNTDRRDELGTLASSLNAAFDRVANQAVWFRNLFDAIMVPIVVTDLDKKTTFANAAFTKFTGRSLEQLMGKPCSDSGIKICKTEQCGVDCFKRGKARVQFEDGAEIHEVSSFHMKDATGHDVGYIEIFDNITEQESLKRKAQQAAIQGKLDAAAQLQGIVDVISSASAELSVQIEQSERGAAEQATRVTETATAMNEMNSTVLEVARNASIASDMSHTARSKALEGAEVVQRSVQGIQTVQEQSLQLKEDMQTLGENAQAITQIMSVISDIADQTNLLALNAAIEAARAGEAGRGFAVVADEVRKLAEKTMQSTADVGNAIKAIQQSASKSMEQVDETVADIENATSLAARSGESLTSIVEMVEGSSDQVRAIATASEEQSATSEEINKSIEHINVIAEQNVHTMNEASRAVADLATQSQQLVKLIDDLKRT